MQAFLAIGFVCQSTFVHTRGSVIRLGTTYAKQYSLLFAPAKQETICILYHMSTVLSTLQLIKCLVPDRSTVNECKTITSENLQQHSYNAAFRLMTAEYAEHIAIHSLNIHHSYVTAISH